MHSSLHKHPTCLPQGEEYGDDGVEDMVDAQEDYDDDAEREDYEDAQREFASPAGSQSGDANDLLGGQQSNHINHSYTMDLTS